MPLPVPERDVLNSQRLTKLLADGFDPSAYCAFGYYPLELAAMRRNVECVRMLLAAGAQPDVSPEKIRPSNVLVHATKGTMNTAAMSVICQLLVEHGAKTSGNDPLQDSPLHAAVKAGHHEAVKVLVALGADIEEVAVSRIYRDEPIGTPLRRARLAFAEPMMVTLLRLGADDQCLIGAGMSIPGQTPFQECVRSGMNQVVRYYLDERGEQLDQRTAAGQTLIQLARKEPTKRMLRALIDEADLGVPMADIPPMLRARSQQPSFA
jgi:ankyrin repeat protein